MRGMLLAAGTMAWATATVALATDDFERPPISYSTAETDNCITRLEAALASGAVRLDHKPDRGFLEALLAALDVPRESQMLVFSQTSLQRHRISPRRPRAVYFNDEVYVGYCQQGDVLEITAVDPQLGAVFYTLDQQADAPPQFVRQTDSCLICHSSARTGGVPGHLVRSLYVDPSGQPLLSAGSYAVDHTTPFAQRWGGWYVTGSHGAQQHLGNLVVPRGQSPREMANAEGQNVTDLSARLAVEKYPTPHSDLVALMVLEHQTLVHNRLTQANFATRQALAYERDMNEALGKPADERLESTERRIRSAGDKLIEALLMTDEAPLAEPVAGTAGFVDVFAARGPHDAQGRTLRDLELTQRLFKYPCSYLIYSEAFAELPEAMRTYVWQRLREILVDGGGGAPFAHLSAADRRAIVEILQATHPALPPSWPSPSRG